MSLPPPLVPCTARKSSILTNRPNPASINQIVLNVLNPSINQIVLDEITPIKNLNITDNEDYWHSKHIYNGNNMQKTIKEIISLEFIINCNYDGVKGKTSLKNLKIFNCLKLATNLPQCEFIKQVRSAIRKLHHLLHVNKTKKNKNIALASKSNVSTYN